MAKSNAHRPQAAQRSRLRSNDDFQTVFAQGKRLHGKALQILYRPRPPDQPGFGVAQFGIAVGRKYGTAVWRNRIRRALRLEIRDVKSQFPEEFQVVISVLTRAKESPIADLRNEAKSLLEKAIKAIARG